nr:sigma-54 dependent transcriptional regulator [uncultured Desulfobacter sp.]
MNLKVNQESMHDVMIIGSSLKMKKIMNMIYRITPSSLPVLITGPTGCGKEVIASVVHLIGGDPDLPFVDLNCAAIPETLIESLLFGHERGVFTGAMGKHQGYLSIASNGTLFLDEIGELPLSQQAKLLRVIETREFRPLGGTANLPFEARVIAATNSDLESMINKRQFREDLYYRLNVLKLEIPSLNERRQDIPEFIDFFLGRIGHQVRFTDGAVRILMALDWPGNIRQLKNTIEKIVLLSEDNPISSKSVLALTHQQTDSVDDVFDNVADQVIDLVCDDKIERMEAALIRRALMKAEGNKSRAARFLSVHRKYIERKAKTLNVV